MNNDIGKFIKLYREAHHWTQSKLAEQLGVSQRNISYYESGERVPPADVLKKISILFDVTVDTILGLKKMGAESNDCYDYFYEEGDTNWNIRNIATKKNISHDELLEKSCIDKERFELIWYGNVQPVAEELIRIAYVLDVSIDFLLNNSQREKITSDEELILRYYHQLPDEVMDLLESFCTLTSKKERSIVMGKCFELERGNSSVAADEKYLDNQGKSLPSSGTEG